MVFVVASHYESLQIIRKRIGFVNNLTIKHCDRTKVKSYCLKLFENDDNSSINEFLRNIDSISAPDEASDGPSNIVVPLPFKDQKSANSVKREMQNLSAKIGMQIKPVFQSKKISQVLSPKEY